MSKFNNKFTKYLKSTYHSKAEAEFAKLLNQLLKEGKVDMVAEQVRYPLPNREGKMRLAYIADFVVTRKGKEFILDVKGVLTSEMVVKLSFFKYYYGKDVTLVFYKYKKVKNKATYDFDLSFLEE